MRTRGLTLFVALLSAGPLAAADFRIESPAGEALAGAAVEVFGCRAAPVHPVLRRGKTDAGGLLTKVPEADCLVLVVDHASFLPRVLSVDAKSSRVLRLASGGSLSGVVLQPGNVAASRGEVCATWQAEMPELRRSRTWERCGPLSGQGSFRLLGLPAEPVQVRVDAPGFLRESRSARVGTDLRVNLTPGVQVIGRVTVRGGGPIAGARVRGPDEAEFVSEPNGEFAVALRKLPATVTISAEGFHSVDVPVENRPSPRVAVELERGEELAGRLVGPESLPVPEAHVWLEQRTSSRSRVTGHQIVTREGDFRIALPGPGDYHIRIGAIGFREERLGPFTVAPASTYALGLIGLVRGASVRGRVIDVATGNPVPGVGLELFPQGSAVFDAWNLESIPRGVSDAEGRFELDAAVGGRFELRTERAGYAAAARVVRVPHDRIEDIGDLAIGRGVSVSGRVLRGRSRRPCAAASVQLLDSAGADWVPLVEAATGSDGTFGPLRVAPGQYLVRVKTERLLLAEQVEIPNGDAHFLDLRAAGVGLRGVVHRAGTPLGPGRLVLISALDGVSKRGVLAKEFRDDQGNSLGRQVFNGADSRVTAEVRPDGTFETEDAPTGLVWAAFLPQEGTTVTREAVVPDDEEPVLVIDFGGEALPGVVSDAATGEGLEAVAVELLSDRGNKVATVATDPGGAFSFSAVAPGVYSVRAYAAGFRTGVVEGVRVGPEETASPLELRLDAAADGSLRLRLSRSDGSPMSSVLATVLDRSGSVAGSVPTDSLGEHLYSNLKPGQYHVVWSDSVAGTGATGPVEVKHDTEVEVARALDDGSTVTVECEPDFCGGRPVRNLVVRDVNGVSLGPFLSGVTTAMQFSPEGLLVLGRLSPGQYTLDLMVGKHQWTRTFAADGRDVEIAVP